MGDRAGQTCAKPHTQHRCFSCLDDAWRIEFGDEAERPHWAELLSAEGDCYLCVLPDPGIEAAALGASESSLPGTAPVEALHTFTLDSGASASSLTDSPDPESDCARAASPAVPRLLATVVTDPSFDSADASALVAELVEFAAACRLEYAACRLDYAACRLDYATSLVAECEQEDFECFAAAVPHLVSMVIAPEGDPDAPNIPTPRSYEEAITGTYSVKRPPGYPPDFKARYLARGFSQRQGVDFFHTFSPTPKMTTLRGSLHKEIWLLRPPGFTGSFPAGTQWSLRRPLYSLRQAPREWLDTLRTTFGALGFAPSTADPSLFLRTDTSLPPFYVLMYFDDLVFATADTEALALVKSELQKRHTYTDLGELRSYLGLQITQDRARHTITLTQSLLATVHSCAYRILARYAAPERHRPEHWEATKRVLRYLCSTSGMGLVLGGRGPVVLTGHADASWVDNLATQRSSQGYTFRLGSDSISWRSTRSSSVLSSSCEAEIYAGAMATQELR
ncbi:unnamed protein product [Closterium sp. NIES-53]